MVETPTPLHRLLSSSRVALRRVSGLRCCRAMQWPAWRLLLPPLLLVLLRPVAVQACTPTCSGFTCDDLVSWTVPCADSEAWGCDCTGCFCGGLPPPSAPPPAPPPTTAVSAVTELVAAIGFFSDYDIIVLSPGTYELTATLNISRSLILEAEEPGTAVLDGGGWDKEIAVLAVGPDAVVQIRGITVANGFAWWEDYYQHAGGIINAGILTLTDVTVTGCGSGFSCGIFNLASLNISNCQITNNTQHWGAYGGGIGNAGLLHMSHTNVSGNQATWGSGGGLYNAGLAYLTDCLIHDKCAHPPARGPVQTAPAKPPE